MAVDMTGRWAMADLHDWAMGDGRGHAWQWPMAVGDGRNRAKRKVTRGFVHGATRNRGIRIREQNDARGNQQRALLPYIFH